MREKGKKMKKELAAVITKAREQGHYRSYRMRGVDNVRLYTKLPTTPLPHPLALHNRTTAHFPQSGPVACTLDTAPHICLPVPGSTAGRARAAWSARRGRSCLPRRHPPTTSRRPPADR